MVAKSIERLEFLCAKIPPLVNKIDEANFSAKPDPQKWSKKEIIGHLIDSATNNHQRLVRSQFELNPTIIYDQDKWNEFNYYNRINSKQIISFWTACNRQLTELLKNIPQEKMKNTVNTGAELNYTNEFLIEDYIEHLEHHLRQVVTY